MDKLKATPKDFFLWAGALLALYGGVVAFIALMFDYINYTFPDTVLKNNFVDPYQGGVSYEMATLIVLTPVLLVLMRLIRRNITLDSTRSEIWVRRWGLFLTVFLAGATIVVDLIVLLTAFLNGEDMTARFLLKVAVVLLVASAGFMHFMADLWGYWQQKPHYAHFVNWATALLVALTIGAGFLIIGTPASQRAYRIDQQRVNDLATLQSYIVFSYYQPKQQLPVSLSAINDPIQGFTVPKDPKTGEDYGYRTTNAPGAMPSFELCATFDTQSLGTDASYTEPMGRSVSMSENWKHGVGQTCFERVIDPSLYTPAYPKSL
jgi:hypothetical protein